jgi:hypothetical protein
VSLALQRHGGLDLERYIDKASGDKTVTAGNESDAAYNGNYKGRGKDWEQYVQQLQNTLLHTGNRMLEEECDDSQEGQWAIQQLCGVLKHSAALAEVKLQVLKFLAVHAFFSIDTAAAQKVGCCPFSLLNPHAHRGPPFCDIFINVHFRGLHMCRARIQQ